MVDRRGRITLGGALGKNRAEAAASRALGENGTGEGWNEQGCALEGRERGGACLRCVIQAARIGQRGRRLGAGGRTATNGRVVRGRRGDGCGVHWGGEPAELMLRIGLEP